MRTATERGEGRKPLVRVRETLRGARRLKQTTRGSRKAISDPTNLPFPTRERTSKLRAKRGVVRPIRAKGEP